MGTAYSPPLPAPSMMIVTAISGSSTGAKPVNLMDWGGCDTGTAARLGQWRANGFGAPQYADVLLRENVRYVCTEGDIYLDLMDRYMRDRWGASGYEISDRLPNGILIVRFLAE